MGVESHHVGKDEGPPWDSKGFAGGSYSLITISGVLGYCGDVRNEAQDFELSTSRDQIL